MSNSLAKLFPLTLPYYRFRLKLGAGRTFIFDEIRKKFLVLTAEEWVRQHLIKYLIHEKNYPPSLIKIEGGFKVHALQKRCDALLYDNSGNKIMLVECKAPSVQINQLTFDQIAAYNKIHRVQWLLLSNGLSYYCCHIDVHTGNYRFVRDIPSYTAAGRETKDVL